MKSKLQSTFFYLGVLVLVPICFAAGTLTGESADTNPTAAKQRVVKRWAFASEPILLTNLQSKGLNVLSGEPFAADDEWFKGLRFDIENQSTQPIAFLRVYVLLYDVKGYDGALGIPLQWGQPPTLRGGRVVSNPINPLARGSKITLSVTEEMYERIKGLVEKKDSIANVSEVRLLTSSVIYTDGTMWKGGSLLYPDETRAGVWTEKKDELAKNSSYLPSNGAFAYANVEASASTYAGCKRVSGSFFLQCCSGECHVTVERTTFASNPGCAMPVAVTVSCQPCSFATCLTQEAAPCECIG